MSENENRQSLARQVGKTLGLLAFKLDENFISKKNAFELAHHFQNLPSLEKEAEYSTILYPILKEAKTETEVMQKYHDYLNSTATESR